MILSAGDYLTMTEIIHTAVADVGESHRITGAEQRRHGAFSALAVGAHSIVGARQQPGDDLIVQPAGVAAAYVLHCLRGGCFAVFVTAKTVRNDEAVAAAVKAVLVDRSAAAVGVA